jgi:hypothetical protein
MHRIEDAGADLVQELIFRDALGNPNLIGHFRLPSVYPVQKS